MEKDNLYIESIRFGFDRIKSGVSVTDLMNHLNSVIANKGQNINHRDRLLILIYLDVFDFDDSMDVFIRNYEDIKDVKYFIKLDSYLKLLQHDELKFSVVSAKKAISVAIWSIIISGLIGVSSLIMALVEFFYQI